MARRDPFFERSAPGSAPRRLLLVSYHFPPGRGAGALRWQKLATYAAERGWGLDVVTLHPEHTANPDTSRLDELPPGIRVFGVPATELTVERFETAAWKALCKLRARRAASGVSPRAASAPAAVAPPVVTVRSHRERRWLRDVYRGYCAWLDYARHAAWADAAAALARDVLNPRAHRAIVTCGPPHMVHEAGRRLAAESGIPLVLDLRDPWSQVQRLPESIASPVWYALARRYERGAIRAATLVIANTDPAAHALAEVYPAARERIMAVMNGYDAEPVPPPRYGDRFTLGYAGTIYLDRDPRGLFRAVAGVVRELGLTPDDLAVELMGNVQSYQGLSVEALARAEGVADFVRVHAPGTRAEALHFLASAALLVSLPQDSDMAIPSKLFEYMQFDAWILALAERESASGQVLRGTDADVVSPNDIAGIEAVIQARYQEFRAGRRPTAAPPGGPLSRAAQAARLLDALDEIAAPA